MDAHPGVLGLHAQVVGLLAGVRQTAGQGSHALHRAIGGDAHAPHARQYSAIPVSQASHHFQRRNHITKILHTRLREGAHLRQLPAYLVQAVDGLLPAQLELFVCLVQRRQHFLHHLFQVLYRAAQVILAFQLKIKLILHHRSLSC
ncbi:hypothetical protein D3C81_682080 [compost metagenome]